MKGVASNQEHIVLRILTGRAWELSLIPLLEVKYCTGR